MKRLFLFGLVIFSFFVSVKGYAQLKESNYLLLQNGARYKIVNHDVTNIKGFIILDTGWKESNDLNFYYNSKSSSSYCCAYQEEKKIPKSWHIVTVGDILHHLEEHRTITPANKLFMVMKDSCRNVYKAYQVQIIDGWMTD